MILRIVKIGWPKGEKTDEYGVYCKFASVLSGLRGIEQGAATEQRKRTKVGGLRACSGSRI